MSHTLEDLNIMALTIYGEARGEPLNGKYAVGCVIYNRWLKRKNKGTSISDICLQPKQFSCWNHDDPNRKYLNANITIDGSFSDCINEASFILLLNGKHTDITKGARHYHTKSIIPYWAEGKNPCYEIGNHLFYNNIA